jgi:hypothetical protein
MELHVRRGTGKRIYESIFINRGIDLSKMVKMSSYGMLWIPVLEITTEVFGLAFNGRAILPYFLNVKGS